jgi:hypothetical protein
MDRLIQMKPTGAEHLREIAHLWASYGPALRAKSALDGGMTWKSVSGAEYLCRYRQDPETGKKKFTSLGRRSPQTEEIYRDFLDRREAAKHVVVSSRDQMATAGRVAKAYGLARMPAKSAEILRAIWFRSLDANLAVFGGTALLAYELEAEVMAPAGLIRDEALIVIPFGDDVAIDDLAAAYEAAVGEKPRVREREDRHVLHGHDAVVLEVWSRELLLQQFEDCDQAEVVEDSFDAPLLRGLTVARDAQPVEFSTFDPRVYAMLAQGLGHDDSAWMERASFASAIVRERWPDQFEPRQEAAFPDLCLDAQADGFRAR